MRENKLFISINKPLAEVFEFTINPANTSLWIEHLEIEETNESPPRIGTIYRNKDQLGLWAEYKVTLFEKNKIFELKANDGNYRVRYTYTEAMPGSTLMEYFEWVDQGNLDSPFTQDILMKLKQVMERTYC